MLKKMHEIKKAVPFARYGDSFCVMNMDLVSLVSELSPSFSLC